MKHVLPEEGRQRGREEEDGGKGHIVYNVQYVQYTMYSMYSIQCTVCTVYNVQYV